MTDVKIAAGILALRVVAISGKAQSGAEIPIGSNVVEGMRIRVAGNESQAMIVPGRHRGLQPVVVGAINIFHLVDEAEVGEGRVKRSAGLLVPGAVIGWNVLIDVPDAHEVRAVIADVSDFQR